MNNPPTKVYKQIVAVVRIINPKTEEVEQTYIRTIDDKDRRKWLTNTLMYALMNGKMAEIINQADDKE